MSMESRLGPLGVWHFTDGMSVPEAEQFAARVEQMGYSALWLPDTIGRDPFAHIAHLADSTTDLIFATGIASIFHRHAGPMAQVANTLAEQSGDRFVLGLGVSHAPMVAGLRKLDYSRPLAKMRDYLAAMDSAPYSAPTPVERPPRILAALGPKMLELSRDAADGAHPYWTTPAHTEEARGILGPDKLLCVEQKIVLSTVPTIAREAARRVLGSYADLPNYRNNWKRLGFSEDEIASRADRFIDAVVAWGDASAIKARLQDHIDAGATHVCMQPVPIDPAAGVDWDCLEALAPRS